MAASFILDFAFLKKIRDLPSPRVFGWHSPFEYISDSFKQSKCKIINVIRDPRSVAVSAYHFYSKLKDVRWEGDWNGFLDLFVNGKGWSKKIYVHLHTSIKFVLIPRLDLYFMLTISSFLTHNFVFS